MSFLRSTRICCCAVIFCLTSTLLSAQAKETSAAVQGHIAAVRDKIMPGTMVKGEPLQTKKLSDLMAEMQVPGVSVAVIRNGQIEWAQGFGVTATNGAPVTADTLFQAASISKPVTALAVLHLVQAGKLDLDADVNQYLKSWKLPGNEFTAKQKVTLRELLSHTAGTTVHGFAGYAAGVPVPTLVQVLNGEKPANSQPVRVDTVPGTEWRYSGGGYEIIQLVLEEVTGKPFPKIMQELVLGPIGMKQSTYEQPLPAARMKEAAMPYRPDGKAVEGGPHTYPEMAAAALWTTPSDLARFAMEVQKALAGKSKVISAATARMMVTPVKNHYGLGLGIGGDKARPYFGHGGSNEGFQCNLMAYENGDGAVIMTNSDRGGAMVPAILRTLGYEYKWPDFQPAERSIAKIDPKVFDAYVGAYLVGGEYMTVSREGDHFYAHLTGQDPVEIFPENEHEFFLKSADAQLSFTPATDGKPLQVTMRQMGNTQGSGPRLGERETKLVMELQQVAPVRFKDQKQDPRTEAVARQVLEDIRQGQPKYDQMMPALGDLLRRDLPEIQAQLKATGAVKALEFQRVGPRGADIYKVKTEKGDMECRLMLAGDGTIIILGF